MVIPPSVVGKSYTHCCKLKKPLYSLKQASINLVANDKVMQTDKYILMLVKQAKLCTYPFLKRVFLIKKLP
jgi:hypothetical protein